MEARLAQPRGFCAGVVRAVEIVEPVREMHCGPVSVFHEIVHSPHVVEDLRTRGAVFVESLEFAHPRRAPLARRGAGTDAAEEGLPS